MENKEQYQIKHEGVLPLGGVTIDCYVLENGTRVLSGRGMQNALKLTDASSVTDTAKLSGVELSRFLGGKWFKDLISKGYALEHFKPLICYKGNQKINGYEATMLADLCDIMLEARNKDLVNTDRRLLLVKQCEILMRAFAKVGIIALVDEATGYQYEREQGELQAILKLFISEEILSWQQTFHLGFYKEIFRLWNIPFTDKNIKRKPQFVGRLTNELVYKKLPKGSFILEKLKKKTPKTKSGNYIYRLHQSLTPDVGR